MSSASNSTLAGQTVLITGAARGIGAATARRLHAQGANVALVGLEPELLAELIAELGPERAAWFEADVTDTPTLRKGIDAAAERFGSIDIAIANAGVHYIGSFMGSPLEQLERELEINLLGVVRTDHLVLPYLKASGGYLLNIASLAAITHAPLMTSYAASKAGVEALTDSLRIEMQPFGVGVGCAYFGFIDTDMVRDAFADESSNELKGLMPGFVSGPVSVDQAVDAIERAIHKRSSRTWAPRFVGGALAGRGPLQPLIEKRMAGAKSRVKRAVELADAANAKQ